MHSLAACDMRARSLPARAQEGVSWGEWPHIDVRARYGIAGIASHLLASVLSSALASI